MSGKNWAAIAILIVAIFVSAVLADKGFSGIASFIDFELRGEDYAALFTHLIIVTAIVERFIAVYTSIWRNPEKTKLEQAVSAESQIAGHEKEHQQCESDLQDFRAQTAISTMYIGFIMGLFVALAGVNILGVLFNAAELSPNQFLLFKGVDTVLTAGLIAGGSKGLNQTIDSILKGIKNLRPTT